VQREALLKVEVSRCGDSLVAQIGLNLVSICRVTDHGARHLLGEEKGTL
jgi:hypothetical protein